MGWERRGNRLYYYRKIRKGNQVVSEYVGTGELAQWIYVLKASDQQQREDERQEWKQKKAEVQAVDLESGQMGKLLRSLISATMLTSGYHPHKGQWRKCRND